MPVPEVAAAVLERLQPRSEPLLDALARELERLRGVRVPRDAFDLSRLPPHLRMTFRVEDERGALVAEGDDLDALREQVRPRLREELAAAAAPLERHGLRDWTIGELPKVVALPGTGQAVRGYPALVDEGDARRRARARDARRRSARRCTRARASCSRWNVPSPIRHVQGRLGNAAQLALAGAPHASPRAVLEDATVAALEALMAEAGGPAWDEQGFARLRDHVAGNLAERTAAGRRRGGADPRRRARRSSAARRRSARRAGAGAGARGRRSASSAGSCSPASSPRPARARLPDVERYLRAAARRLERLPHAPAPDLDRMRSIQELEAEYERRASGVAAGPPAPGGAARGPLAARGAAREPLRAGARHARPGLGEADPARAGAGRHDECRLMLPMGARGDTRAAAPCRGPAPLKAPLSAHRAGAVRPSTRPRRPSASTTTLSGRPGTRSVVSNPSRGTVASAPAMRQLATCVAPFQLACTTVVPPASLADARGRPSPRARHGIR